MLKTWIHSSMPLEPNLRGHVELSFQKKMQTWILLEKLQNLQSYRLAAAIAIGEDTTILVLLSFFADQNRRDLIFTSDKVGKVTRRCYMKRFAEPFGEA